MPRLRNHGTCLAGNGQHLHNRPPPTESPTIPPFPPPLNPSLPHQRYGRDGGGGGGKRRPNTSSPWLCAWQQPRQPCPAVAAAGYKRATQGGSEGTAQAEVYKQYINKLISFYGQGFRPLNNFCLVTFGIENTLSRKYILFNILELL